MAAIWGVYWYTPRSDAQKMIKKCALPGKTGLYRSMSGDNQQ